jgi:hypothetical protein
MGEDDGSRFALAIRQEITAVDNALHCFFQRQFVVAQDALMALVHNQATFFGMMRCSAHSQS